MQPPTDANSTIQRIKSFFLHSSAVIALVLALERRRATMSSTTTMTTTSPAGRSSASATSSAKTNSAKPLGTFDCVYRDPDARAPVPGKLSVFETALSFTSNILGMNFGGTNVKMKLRDVSEVDGTTRLALKITGRNDKVLLLSFTNSAPAFDCLATSWKLVRADADVRIATGPGLHRKKKSGGAEAKNLIEYGKDLFEEYKETMEIKARSFVEEASKLGAKPRPTPKMPMVDVEDEVSRALFIRLVRATNVVAMDSGGTSDPFASVRYRGLESTSKTIWKTLEPEWDEVFTFRVPPNKTTLDETDFVELHIFDRDVALHDFIGYVKLDLTGTRVYSSKRTKMTLELKNLPADQQPDFFDVNHLKEKLMFWEGERQITGTVEIEYWLGNRHDADYRIAGVPLLRKPDPRAGEAMNHFCDPVSALLRVEVKCGRNIINLDDDDGSDPYVEVAVVQPDGTEEKHQTHYIDDATDPEWNSTFNFIAAKPYKADLVFRMYDYDGVTSYDDLIGMVRIPISELQTHKGITKFPDSQWYTLLDAEGKDCDKEGTKYGDIEIRAYLDEEYFEHLHGGNTSKAVGKLTLDVLEAKDLEGAPDTYVMVKTGPYWSRLSDQKAQSNPQWNVRLRYPIIEPSEPVTVGVFNLSDGSMIGKIRCVLSGLDDGLRYEDDFPLKTVNRSGVVVTNGTLRCSFTFKHKSTASFASRYMQPVLPDKWYIQPLSDTERRRMLRAHSMMMMKRLYNSNPSIPEVVSKELLDFSKQDVSIKSIKSSIARMERVVTNLTSIGDNLSYALSWESIPLTIFVQLVMVYVIHHPHMFFPMFFLSIAFQSLMRFPSRYQRTLDRCVPDDWLTVGLAFPPDSEEELEKKKASEAEAKKKLEEAKKLALEEEKRKEAEKKEEEKESEIQKPREVFSFESLNPLAALQRQMDEITQMITDAQVVLDDAAGILERVVGILDWDEPRVTACVVVGLFLIAWAFIFIDAVIRFITTVVVGVFVKTFFTIFSPVAIKWGVSFATLFALRHPAILPDAATAAIEEEKRLRRAAAQAAAQASSAGAKVESKDKAEIFEPKSAVFDPRPLAPVNVFYRIPTQATRVL